MREIRTSSLMSGMGDGPLTRHRARPRLYLKVGCGWKRDIPDLPGLVTSTPSKAVINGLKPDTAPISGLPLVGRQAVEYPRP